ncbi:MAG: hypothetical protein IIZ70_02395 [Kiritimatiellae bacterium]|nr:hypothetical protein [Kiritimatiellia bacterium]
MAETVQTVLWKGGELDLGPAAGRFREAVLAVPMDRILVKVVKIPSANLEDPVAYVMPVMKAMSPFPDEPLAVSLEPLREAEDGRIVLAAALPEGSADDIATALDGAGINITRIDAIPLGRLSFVLPRFAGSGKRTRRLLLMGDDGSVAAFVLDDDLPVAVRAISESADMKRELTLLLLEAEGFAGALPVSEVVVLGTDGASPESVGLDGSVAGILGDARVTTVADGDPALPGDAREGITKRTEDPSSLNVLPDSWREVLEETRFKRKMRTGFGVAGGLWLLLMAVLLGVPKVYEYRTERLLDRKEESALFRKVNAKVEQVKAVKAMSNHDQGGLETLRAVVSAMPPDDIELSRWNFKRNEKLTFSGTVASGSSAGILQFKDNLGNLALSQISGLEEDGETPFFAQVTLPRGINTRAGRAATFDVECSFVAPEEEEEE